MPIIDLTDFFNEEASQTISRCFDVYLSCPKFEEESDLQHDINCRCALSAWKKIMNNDFHFIPDEVRIIGVALLNASLILRGEVECPESKKQLISPFIFSINKLYSRFGTSIDPLENE